MNRDPRRILGLQIVDHGGLIVDNFGRNAVIQLAITKPA
jgi:hypothetical protein